MEKLDLQTFGLHSDSFSYCDIVFVYNKCLDQIIGMLMQGLVFLDGTCMMMVFPEKARDNINK